MIYRIVQYIQPWEIDQLERQINKMIPSSYLIEGNHFVIWDVSMNLEIVDWEKSNIRKQFFIDKFNYLKYIVSLYFKEEFDISEEIKGAADKKRNCSEKNQDYTIWLDSDIYFPESCLAYIVKTTENLNPKNYHIVTPEIIKYWDSSWDCITHEKFLGDPFNQRDYFDLYSLDSIPSQCDVSIEDLPNGVLKFGAGWFTTLSDKLIKDVKIPKELGSYGPDDTYVMLCSKKLSTTQYIIRGVVVSEIGKRFEKMKDYYKPQLSIKIKDRNKISDEEFKNLVVKFYESK